MGVELGKQVLWKPWLSYLAEKHTFRADFWFSFGCINCSSVSAKLLLWPIFILFYDYEVFVLLSFTCCERPAFFGKTFFEKVSSFEKKRRQGIERSWCVWLTLMCRLVTACALRMSAAKRPRSVSWRTECCWERLFWIPCWKGAVVERTLTLPGTKRMLVWTHTAISPIILAPSVLSPQILQYNLHTHTHTWTHTALSPIILSPISSFSSNIAV